jgi:hypothetical protein
MSSQHSHHAVVTGLAAAGAVPFGAFVVLALTGTATAFALHGLLIYSLAILCFLAGSWWGLALLMAEVTSRQRGWILVLSNGVVVLAVTATLLLPPRLAVFALGAMYLLLLSGEASIVGLQRQPDYYRNMRLRVSMFAVGAHVLVGLANVSVPA